MQGGYVRLARDARRRRRGGLERQQLLPRAGREQLGSAMPTLKVTGMPALRNALLRALRPFFRARSPEGSVYTSTSTWWPF